ncbi:MAG TPA: aminoacetone oxidase family FAD-binding enzyme [Vicinamibacterales bacterium]|nr:aminoacetone oxidase family FAD-binding enzyme [Vicinamibacterales bacterium]
MPVHIVGGGAAGLATAIFLARRRPALRIAVLDGARRLGAKILVSGGGRCNLTNRVVTASDYWGGDRRIVASVLAAFPVEATIAFFREIGVSVHEEESGKLFPDTNRARTVLDALLDEAGRLGVTIVTGERVTRLEPLLAAGPVVLATGGRSLPKSGSDGEGLRMAASLGHTIVETTPALAPLVVGCGLSRAVSSLSGKEGTAAFHQQLSGVSHDAALTVEHGGRQLARLRGPLLWTHFGVSGPVALDASRHWHRAALGQEAVRVRVSFLPALDARGAEQALLEAAGRRPAASLRSTLASLVPSAVADAVLAHLSIEPAVQMAQLPRATRAVLAKALVGWDLAVTGSRGYNFAEATAGGVALDEVNRATLESRVRPGLYLVGEMLDVDGRLGGFNFQWAWSSAWVAARGIATGR